MSRFIAAAALAAAVAGLAGAALAAPPAGDVDGVWVGGTIHNLVVTGPAKPGAAATPLYVIAPVASTRPLHPLADARTHGFGAHDHVIGLARPAETFNGACDLTLLVPGPKAKLGANVMARPTATPSGAHPLLYAVRLGGRLVPLNSAARIGAARKSGLAVAVDTHTLVACTVSVRAKG